MLLKFSKIFIISTIMLVSISSCGEEIDLSKKEK